MYQRSQSFAAIGSTYKLYIGVSPMSTSTTDRCHDKQLTLRFPTTNLQILSNMSHVSSYASQL